MSGPGSWRSPPPPWPQRPVPTAPPRASTSGLAVAGRVLGILGISAGAIACAIWILVGMFALAAAPLCTECIQDWLPPVALGALGSLGPLLLWSITLIVAWRHWSLLLWSLVGWPVLGAINVRAIEWFATLFNA